MKIKEYNDIYKLLNNKIAGDKCFESNIFLVDNYVYKIFKIEKTYFNPQSYLYGKEMKAYLLENAFKDNPNIVSPKEIIYDQSVIKGLVYPYIENSKSVGTVLYNKNISFDQKKKVMLAFSNTIKEMHSKGCWHLDLTPANLLIDNVGNPYIIDMDSSKIDNYPADGRDHETMKLIHKYHYPVISDENLDCVTLLYVFIRCLLGVHYEKILTSVNRDEIISNSVELQLIDYFFYCIKEGKRVLYLSEINFFNK